MKKYLLAPLALALCCSMVIGCGKDQKIEETQAPKAPTHTMVAIGTGAIADGDYLTGGAIAEIVNQRNGVRCAVTPTADTAFNVNAIVGGELQFGLVSSDQLYHAWNGSPNTAWAEKGPQKDLRSCFGIRPESVALVAAVDAGINTILDLKGRHVNIGNTGSAERRDAVNILKAVGLNYETDLLAEAIHADESAGLLQEGRIDAFFCILGRPGSAIEEAAAGNRKIRFAAITGIGQLLEKHPYYGRTLIPAKLYPEAVNEGDVETFGAKSIFVTSIQVPDDVVYTVVKAVFDNFEAFKSVLPAYPVLTPKEMLEGLSMPLHPGAERYFKEAGWL